VFVALCGDKRFWKKEEKMLGIFNKGLVQPPQELNSPAPLNSSVKPKHSQEILKDFISHSSNTFSISFGDATSFAYLPPEKSSSIHHWFFFFFFFFFFFLIFIKKERNK
jgi:hypothetical protein